MITSGFVSSRTFPSSAIPAAAWSSSSGFSSGGRVNMYGVWHVPTAATISPMAPLSGRPSLDPVCESRVDSPRVGLEDPALVGLIDRRQRVDVALRIVEVLPRLRIDAAD